MEVLQHEHPLTLIDLNPEYPRDEVVYDDEEELIMKQDFRCPCGRCGQEINFYHRYYYTCDQCDHPLHKLCAELPTTLRHESHRDHNLILYQVSEDKWCMCQACKRMLNHFHEESGSRAFETNLTHPFHRHPLTLVDTPSCSNDINTTPSIHDSMKMVEVVCDACIRPITNLPFYKCTTSDDGCNFVLHAWCTRLPTEFETMGFLFMPESPITLNFKLLPQVPKFMGVFQCQYCDLHCNGFVYNCSKIEYNVDVHCVLTPPYITHKSHPNHLLQLLLLFGKRHQSFEKYCRLCLSDTKKQLLYICEPCEFTIHSKCALLWPDTVSHKYDKHQLTLRYFPVENYSGDYFCEVCEEEFNPNAA
ncbi:zinc finger, PHD-type containing protein, partial [Tanacetum coccineum]